MNEFEKLLTEIPKPKVKALRHEDMLADELIRVKDKASVSLWWLLVPLYTVAMLSMKTYYKKTLLSQELWMFHEKQPLLSIILFIAGPLILMVFNFAIKKHFPSFMVLFRRKGIFFIPISTGGWLILLTTICYLIYNAFVLNARENSISDFLINLIYSLLLIGAIYSLIAFLTLKKRP